MAEPLLDRGVLKMADQIEEVYIGTKYSHRSDPALAVDDQNGTKDQIENSIENYDLIIGADGSESLVSLFLEASRTGAARPPAGAYPQLELADSMLLSGYVDLSDSSHPELIQASAAARPNSIYQYLYDGECLVYGVGNSQGKGGGPSGLVWTYTQPQNVNNISQQDLQALDYHTVHQNFLSSFVDSSHPLYQVVEATAPESMRLNFIYQPEAIEGKHWCSPTVALLGTITLTTLIIIINTHQLKIPGKSVLFTFLITS